MIWFHVFFLVKCQLIKSKAKVHAHIFFHGIITENKLDLLKIGLAFVMPHLRDKEYSQSLNELKIQFEIILRITDCYAGLDLLVKGQIIFVA